MRISIVGTGYVGLVTGVCLADRGHQVTCVDLDPRKTDNINRRIAPIHEAGLPGMLERVAGSRLNATTDLAAAVRATEITFIAVGTPAHEGRIDLTYVERAAAEIGQVLAGKPDYHTVVVKSTVIPGTTDGPVRQALERAATKQAGSDFGLGMNPEFLTEGQAVEDFLNPDRIVIGGIDERTRETIAGVYESFAGVPIIRTNNRTAEMIKYASNSVLATLISFSNEIGRLCSAVGDVDIADVMRGVHAAGYFTRRSRDGEVWSAPIVGFLQAGCGFGGSCLPKDVTALVAQGKDSGLSMALLSSVLDINHTQPAEVLALARKHYAKLAGVRVTVLGLAFKPGTDDVRESPAFPIVAALQAEGATVTLFDPVADARGLPQLDKTRIATSLADALEQAQIVIQVTSWPEFANLARLLEHHANPPLVIDGRRNLSPGEFQRYEGIGR